MIIKRRSKPLSLQKLKAIVPRISVNGNHMLIRELNKEIDKEYKGYIGERKVDYFLDILANRATILQSVCLRVNDKNFQIDTRSEERRVGKESRSGSKQRHER